MLVNVRVCGDSTGLTQAGILALPFSGCVILAKFQDFFETRVPGP